MFLNTDNVGAKRISSGRLFQATKPATQNARLLSCSLVLGTTKSNQTMTIGKDLIMLLGLLRPRACEQ